MEKRLSYYQRNKEKCLARAKIYYLKNKDTIDNRNHLYSINNRSKRNLAAKKYTDERLKNDENYILSRKNHKRLQTIFRGLRIGKLVNSSITSIIGCSVLELKFHIEKQFKEGMSWGNYGKNGWHIDHIKPRCKFNLVDDDQLKVCFHYSNLQPLWEFENRAKGSK